MATPNYSYEKRQRELAKKRKAEEKRQKKGSSDGGASHQEPAGDGQPAADHPAPPAPPAS